MISIYISSLVFYFPKHTRGGGQAKICGTYADLVGTENAGVQIFSMVLQIFSMMHLGEIFLIEMLLECSY